MISQETRSKYRVTIGVECHVQLATKTKLFAAVSNDARDAEPNMLTSHICLGMPGALPVLNEKVLDYASRMAFALGVKPQKYSYFERKHYFYPDLPKGYQISQLAKPIIVGGYVDIDVDGKTKSVAINRVQIEEDAGKSIHPEGQDYSLVDLNRAGTPLLEIVSEPDIHSPEEAKAYARELWLLARYTRISDADLYHGNMRFDVNLSVSTDETTLGTRTETKNLNSFKAVEKAAEYEIGRQIELLEKGQSIVQETRGWDDAKQKTFSQRSKEDAHDYRYFPDPDLPPVDLSDEYISDIEKSMPAMPVDIRHELKDLGVDHSTIETLVEEIILGDFMVRIISKTNNECSRKIANWLAGEVQAQVANGKLQWNEAVLDEEQLIKLAEYANEGKLSSTNAKIVLEELVTSGGVTEKIAQDNNLIQVSDSSEIEKIVNDVISQNESAVNDVRNGEMKAIGFLVGQVMKASKGQANPGLAQEILKKKLS